MEEIEEVEEAEEMEKKEEAEKKEKRKIEVAQNIAIGMTMIPCDTRHFYSSRSNRRQMEIAPFIVVYPILLISDALCNRVINDGLY